MVGVVKDSWPYGYDEKTGKLHSKPEWERNKEEAEKNRSCKSCFFYYQIQLTKHTHTETENKIETTGDKHYCNFGRGGCRSLKIFAPCGNWLYKDFTPAHPLEARIARIERKLERMGL